MMHEIAMYILILPEPIHKKVEIRLRNEAIRDSIYKPKLIIM